MPTTPNIGLNVPALGSNNWGGPLNYNFSQIDLFLSGLLPLPGLEVGGNLVVTGSITAGQFIGLSGGAFLTAALFDQPNGIPQLDGSGKIPASLLPGGGHPEVVPFSNTPVFDGSTTSSFRMTLTGNVTASTFVNGLKGQNLVVFRIVQDGTGGRTFVWPSNVRNAGVINPGVGAISMQLFAVDTDGSLDAVSPMMYS